MSDDLIARLREVAANSFPGYGDVIREAADALEAAQKRIAQLERAQVPREPTKMQRFTGYRPLINEAAKTHDQNQANASDAAQFEGVVFTDGSVAQRWLTAKRSTAVWASLDDVMAIHGHPEYGTRIAWHDAALAERKE